MRERRAPMAPVTLSAAFIIPDYHCLSWLPSAHPSVPNLNHLGWLLSIGDNFHLGLALPLAVPDGHGQVPCLVPFQDVGLCTTPGEDVLQRSQTGPSQPVAFVLSPLKKRFPTGSASKKAVPVWGIVMAAHTFDPSTHGRQRLRQADVCVFETRST